MAAFSGLLLVLLAGLRQAPGQDAPTAAAPGHVVFSPNPPACFANFGNMVGNYGDVWTGVVIDTVRCAPELGFTGASIYGPKAAWFWHDQRLCADGILVQISRFAEAVSDILAACFDCFNSNQACGESVSAAAAFLVWAGRALVQASLECAPQYSTYPFLFQADPAYKGFFCFSRIVRFIQRVLKAAKYIDVALDACQVQAPVPVKKHPAPVPQPKSREAAAEEGEEEDEGSSADGSLPRAAWRQVGVAAPGPFLPPVVGATPAAERRLTADGRSAPAAAADDSVGAMLVELGAMEHHLLDAGWQARARAAEPWELQAAAEEAEVRDALRALSAAVSRGGPRPWVSV